ncbi:MAG: beta strand repeat-containing protein [Haloferacaceae archaeon]
MNPRRAAAVSVGVVLLVAFALPAGLSGPAAAVTSLNVTDSAFAPERVSTGTTNTHSVTLNISDLDTSDGNSQRVYVDLPDAFDTTSTQVTNFQSATGDVSLGSTNVDSTTNNVSVELTDNGGTVGDTIEVSFDLTNVVAPGSTLTGDVTVTVDADTTDLVLNDVDDALLETVAVKDGLIDSCTRITASGSYLLNASLTDVSDPSCIEVETSDVILDGDDRTVDGTNASGSVGINVSSGTATLTNVTVENATVTGWDEGVEYNDTSGGNVTDLNASENLGRGVNLSSVSGLTVEGVTAVRNGDTGISGPYSADVTVRDANASDNAGTGDGVLLGARATVENVTAIDNGQEGIELDDNATIDGATVTDSGDRGIQIGKDGIVRNVTATGNDGDGVKHDDNGTVRNANLSNNNDDGLELDGPVTYVNVTANDNSRYGISGSTGDDNMTLREVTANDNANTGIEVGDDANLTDVAASGNGDEGIETALAPTLENVTANDNGQEGVSLEDNATAVNVTANGNGNHGIGLSFAPDSEVRESAARNNAGAGVRVGDVTNASVTDTVATNNTEGVLLRGAQEPELSNLTLRNNTVGVGASLAETTPVRDALLVDSTVTGSATAIDARDAVNLTGRNVTFDRWTADFTANHANLTDVDPATAPALPDDTGDVGVYADIDHGTTTPANVTLDVEYNGSAATGIDEASIAFWRYDGSWTEVGGTVSTGANRVNATLTEPGTFAPLGGTFPEFVPSIGSTTAPVSAGETLEVSTTVTNDGGTAGEQTVALEVDGAQVDSESVTLGTGASTTLTLRWETAPGDVGSHSVTVRTANDTASTSVDVVDGGDGGGGRPAAQQRRADERAETVAEATAGDVRESADGETATVSVSGTVPADEPARFDTRTDTTADNPVAVDGVTVTADRARSVSLSITQSTDPTPGAPGFTNPRGTEARGHVSIQHDVPNAQVRRASVTFRVRKDLLGPGERPGDVALYRHAGGGWNELPTRRTGETATHYVFRAESPGLSDFTVGVKQARFEITNALVSVTELTTGEGTQVQVRVTNTGGADGTFRVDLLLNGEAVAERTLTVAANGTRRTVFDRSFDEPGDYRVAVNNVSVGTIEVRPANGSGAAGAGAGAGGTATPTPTSTGFVPGFGPLHAALGVVLAALLAARRRRG